jgi:hypothetical protein
MVLAAVMPISLDPETQLSGNSAPVESLAFLTSTESDIINALRESLSNGNNGAVVLKVEIPAAAVSAKERGAAEASEKTQEAPKRAEVKAEKKPAETIVVQKKE